MYGINYLPNNLPYTIVTISSVVS